MCITSIFVDKGMDWKLGGFEFLIGTAELDEGYVNNLKELLPKKYQSPELARGNIQALKQIPVAADLKNIQSMPEALRPDYMRLLSSNPAGRLRPIEMLQNPLFDEEYVSLQLFLETLNVKDAVEKERSARSLHPPTPEP